MEALLAGLQASPPGQWMRGAGVWSYGLTNLVHILGLATLFGAVLMLDLRLLGAWRRVPLRAVESPAVARAITRVGLAPAPGGRVGSTKATDYAGNPFLPIKLAAILLALLNALVAIRLPAWKRRHEERGNDRRTLAIVGGVSLALWLTALTCGRMIGYW